MDLSRFRCFRAFIAVLAVGAPLLMGQVSTSSQPGTSGQASSGSGLASPYYQADFTPVIANGVHLVAWDKGHLVSFSGGEMKEPVTLYDKTGKWLFENPLTLDNAVKVYGQDAAVTTSGTVVIAASALNADGAVADLILEVGKRRHSSRDSNLSVLPA